MFIPGEFRISKIMAMKKDESGELYNVYVSEDLI